jgi:wobble nucleotide-excising tRNase
VNAITQLITSAKKVHGELGVKKEEKRKLADELRSKAQVHQDAIALSKAKITNIDQSIESINTSLAVLGLNGFLVVREEGELPRYRLQRPDQQAGVFKTLSEGEKTLISFLYFLEVCNGELDEKGGKLKSERIIVIDDPISSLSHNYIYDIASMIHRRVLSPKERFKQVFILTHNLFFFHEMLKHLKKADEYSLFRITKAAHSVITPMLASDVQNDYQSFWQAIKDAQAGRTSATVIPNMMRNILEYYFTFVHRQDVLQEALVALADEDVDFKALYRYVNRESHSDAINLTDFGEIVPAHYVERFRQVFVKTGFEEHYDKMMGAVG